MSHLSDSLTLLIKKEGMSESLIFLCQKSYIKHTKKKILGKKCLANCSFAHLSWATWVNRSRLLICHEWPERFANDCSFDMSNLSDLLTVAHLSWVIWANPSQSLISFGQNERMSNERITSPGQLSLWHTLKHNYLPNYICFAKVRNKKIFFIIQYL